MFTVGFINLLPYMKFVLTILLAITFVFACKEDDEAPLLSVSGPDITTPIGGGTPEINISEMGGTSEITITCNENWSISNPVAWLMISEITGNSGTTTIELSAI